MLPKLFPLLICFLFAEDCNGQHNKQYWKHHKVLDREGLYNVYWTVRDETITFKVVVETKGYVGFGLSYSGGMPGADVVTGWIDDGKPYFQDRHCEGNWMPEIDESQDWELLEGYENNTHTILIFCRKLETCDENDLLIDESTMRVIYAFSSEDPISEEQLMYHKANRGTKSVVFLEEKVNIGTPLEELLYWDVRGHEFTVYAENISVYWCTLIKAPKLRTKHHIVKAEPMIQPGNENVIHHMALFSCLGNPEDFEKNLGQHSECVDHNMPSPMSNCEGMFIVWGVGGLGTVLPEHVGFPFGTEENAYYRFEIHYENLLHRNGVTDQSGFRLHFTPDLRKYDGGVMALGVIGDERLLIPPRQKQFVLAGHSSPKCLGKEFPPDGINIMANLFHAHLLGRRLTLRHFRGNKELPPIADDKHYDFNYQDFHYFPKEIKVLPNDVLTVECYFDSTERSNTTFGGSSTIKAEMCLAYVLYYPKVDVFMACSGLHNLLMMKVTNVIKLNAGMIAEPPEFRNVSFRKHFREYDFLKGDVRNLENIFRYGPHIAVCVHTHGNLTVADEIITYPTNLEPYEEPKKCVNSKKTTNILQYFSFSRTKSDGERVSVSTAMTALLVLLSSLSSSYY